MSSNSVKAGSSCLISIFSSTLGGGGGGVEIYGKAGVSDYEEGKGSGVNGGGGYGGGGGSEGDGGDGTVLIRGRRYKS